MNNTQKGITAATIGGAVLAEEIIGGIGVTMLGGAIGIPAAAIVAVGGAVALACTLGNDTDDDSKSVSVQSDSGELSSFFLSKDSTTYKFSVNITKGWGQTSRKLTNNIWCDFKYYSSLQELRDYYKSLLDQGFRPA